MRSILMLFLLEVGSAASDASEPAPSRPYWTGRIEQDTTWRDTVYVGGDVTVAAAATLTLAPNTQVLFLPYYDATQGGLDSTRATDRRRAAGGASGRYRLSFSGIGRSRDYKYDGSEKTRL